MIAYLDSSYLARAYLQDEDGHQQARELLNDTEVGLATSTWTRIEVSGALVRAARAGRCQERDLLALLDFDLADSISLLTVEQVEAEERALGLVRIHGLRAMDAWHLAVATIALPPLLEPGEPAAFATRDEAQAQVATSLGFLTL